MTYAIDPELGAVLAGLAAGEGPVIDDWRSLRVAGEGGQGWYGQQVPAWPAGYPTVEAQTWQVGADEGAVLRARWVTRKGHSPGSAVVFAHGGGMVLGTIDLWDPLVAGYVAATGVPFLSVGYRLAPEVGGQTPARDMYAALRYLHSHAGEYGVDPDRIAIMGESSGGGLAAAVSLLAREDRLPVAAQLLVSPMLDDRTTTAPSCIEPFLTWTSATNRIGWTALLGERVGTEDVSAVEAPARAGDLQGLPPAYVEVGELDLFRDETVRYALRLMEHQVPVELHVHTGVNHGFERAVPTAQVAQRVFADRHRYLSGL
ncbi:alpha/beta hydrolase [Amycolatopsis sp. NPDC051061]|uniref:alpha/beta hydrolase n=1 Tax=Amycolatopsis sp. NPDC051061 TaxID=3155042 RepID=UPI00342D6F28